MVINNLNVINFCLYYINLISYTNIFFPFLFGELQVGVTLVSIIFLVLLDVKHWEIQKKSLGI